MNKSIPLFVAGSYKGAYWRRFVAITRDDAIAGFRAAYGHVPDTLTDDGLAWFDDGRLCDLRITPALSDNYQSPVRGDYAAILDAWRAANPPAPTQDLAPADLSVFFDAMSDDTGDDHQPDVAPLVAAAVARQLPWADVKGKPHVSLSADGYSVPPGGWLSLDDAKAACAKLAGVGDCWLVSYRPDGKVSDSAPL